MNLRIPYYGPDNIIFYDPAVVEFIEHMESLARDVMLVPYSGSSAPTWHQPTEPDYPVLVSDPGPLDAGV